MSWKGFEQIIIDTRIKQKITCRPKRGGIHSLDHIGLKSVNHEHNNNSRRLSSYKMYFVVFSYRGSNNIIINNK